MSRIQVYTYGKSYNLYIVLMLRINYILIFLLSVSCIVQGQTNQHWEAIEQTPNTKLAPQFFFRDGGILARSYAFVSNTVAYTNDKGQSWSFGEADPDFVTTNYAKIRDGLNGQYYYLSESNMVLRELNTNSLETRTIMHSGDRIYDFTIGIEYAYLYTLDSLIQVNINNGEIIRIVSFEEGVRQMNVSEELGLVVFTNTSKILQIDTSLAIKKEVTIDLKSLSDFYLSSENHLLIEEDNQFRHSSDLGETWTTTEALDLKNTWRNIGVKDYFITRDSTVFIYDLAEKTWSDTIYLDTYLNIFGASDALYAQPSKNTYQGLHSIKASEGLLKINDLVDKPNVYSITGLSDTTHFINRLDLLHSSPSLFFQDQDYQNTYDFSKAITLSSGEVVGSTYDSLYISDDGTNNFRVLSPPISPRDHIKKDHLDVLYLFRYDGIWQSFDKGKTWTHECPDGYFPEFDVNYRFVIPTAFGKHYGLKGSKILKYDYDTKNTSTVHSVNSTTSSINGFIVNLSGTLFINYLNKITSKNEILKRNNGMVEMLTIPSDDITGAIAIDWFGVIYIHTLNRVFKSMDAGTSWVEITGDLPSDVHINHLSVSQDQTIYLACQNGPIYRTAKLPSAIGDIDKKNKSVIIAPNPVLNNISLIADQRMNTHAYIVNLHGQVVWKGYLNDFDPNINVSNLNTGMYILFFSDKQYQVRPFIKK